MTINNDISLLDMKYKDVDIDLVNNIFELLGNKEFPLTRMFDYALEFEIKKLLITPTEEKIDLLIEELRNKTISELIKILNEYIEVMQLETGRYCYSRN